MLLPLRLFASVALLAFTGDSLDLHKCARPWPIDEKTSDHKPLDLSHLSNLNKHVLPISSAGHLVRNIEGGANVKDASVQVEVTFGGLATTIRLMDSCTNILFTDENAGVLTGINGAILSNDAKLMGDGCNVVFTPHESFDGETVILYARGDSKLAAVVVQVVPCNRPPVANDDFAESMSGRVVRLNLLSNDVDPEEDRFACMDLPVKEEAGTKKAEERPTIVSFTNIAHQLGLREEQCVVRTSPNCLFDQFDQELSKWDDGGFCMQETLTGGGCVGDVDGDGREDIFYPRMDGHDIIYRNRGDGSFEDISADAGMTRFLRVRSNGCTFLDVDNDGDNDVYVSTVADKQFMLFINDGTGKFTEEAAKRGVDNVPQKSRFRGFMTAGGSIDVADFDLDGYLDIVTTEWLPQLGKKRPADKKAFDQEFNTPGGNNARIFRNLGDEKPGFFEDVTQLVGYVSYPPGQGQEGMAGSMSADRRYDYGSNADIRLALSCVAPSDALAAHGDDEQQVLASMHTDEECHHLDQTCVTNRTKLRLRYQHAINKIQGRDPDFQFFGIKHPMIGTYRGLANKKLGKQDHEHMLQINADHTWTFRDKVVTHENPDVEIVAERTGFWRDDMESDYIASFAEEKEVVTKFNLLDEKMIGTPIVTLKPLNAKGKRVWVQVNVFGRTTFHESLGQEMREVATKMTQKMAVRNMKGAQMAIMNTIAYLYAPGQRDLPGDDVEAEELPGSQGGPGGPGGGGGGGPMAAMMGRNTQPGNDTPNEPEAQHEVEGAPELLDTKSQATMSEIMRHQTDVKIQRIGSVHDPFRLHQFTIGERPFKTALMVYDDENNNEDGGVLEGAGMVNAACKKFKTISKNQQEMEENLRMLWTNPMNANKTVRQRDLIDSHHSRKKDIGGHAAMASRMGNTTLLKIEANQYNMTLQQYQQWKQQKEQLSKFSDVAKRNVRKKGEINHFGNFPLNGVFSFGAKFIDMDDDHFPDLIISGDFGTSQMLWNNRNRTFNRGFFHVIEDTMDNSMGCTVGDWDQDGKQDIMFTSVSISLKDMKSLSKVSEGAGMGLTFNGNHLYRNLGGRRFEDKTDHAGVRLSGWGWGAFFFDFDNDGDLDVLNGNGMDDPETTDDDVFINQKMRLYVNKGRKEGYKLFDEAEAHGIADQHDNRGSMTFDYDGDGDLDVFIVNHGEVPSFYRNDGGDYYDWLRVRVKESSALGQRDSIGARVYVTLRDQTDKSKSQSQQQDGPPATIVREIKSAAAFCGQNELVAHFGLGKAHLQGGVVHQVRIVWPPIVDRSTKDKDNHLNEAETLTEVVLHNVPIRQTLVVRRPDTDQMKQKEKELIAAAAAELPAPVTHRATQFTQSGHPALVPAWTTATQTKKNIISNAGASLPICTHKKITGVSSPSHGQVVIGTSGRYVKYRAFPHFSGTDTFTYTMEDGRGGTSKATVHVNIAEPPTDAHKIAMRSAAKKSKFSSLDGRGNNVEHPDKEAAVFTQLRRLVPSAYAGDGMEDPSGSKRPSARLISNELFSQTSDDTSLTSSIGLNDMHLHFGQFLAHDISFVTPLADFYASGNLAIPVPKGDTTFDPDYTGEAVIRFRRSGGQSGTGREFGIPKQQVNKVTGWLDLSVVYGSADERATAVSSPKNGKIDMQEDGNNLAYNTKGIPNLNLLGKKIERLVISGDNRVNVQPGLLTHHTLWAREHNRIVDELLEKNPTATDRDLFLMARKRNIATYQHIVMYEWLPLLLGPTYTRKHKLHTYEAGGSYDPTNIDARVANEFASMAFRFGHSQVTDTLRRLDETLKPGKHGHLHLRDNYFSPGRVMNQGGIDPILRGMIWTASQEVDTKAVDGIRNFLFGTNTKGFDLVAINIQRGRDHGIPDYNTLRIGIGLEPKKSWSAITSNKKVASILESLYGKDGYNDLDAFVGGLAEDHVNGGSVGELFATIIGDQFYRLRNGDRHWYENTGVSGNLHLMKETKTVTMQDVVERNSELDEHDQVWDGHHARDRSVFLVPKHMIKKDGTRKTEL